MGKLHDKTVKKLIKEKPSVRHADGNGLYLMTPKRGDAYWMLRYTTPATKLRREYTIGKVDDWSLADARDEAARLRLAIMGERVTEVRGWMPELIRAQEEHLKNRFEQAKV